MSKPVGRPDRRAVVRVFVLAFAIYAYFMPRWADWNIDSRLDLAHAIVDKQTLRIDAYNQNTWDKAVYQGHYYSDKAPGTAFLGAIVYAGYRLAHVTPGVGGAIDALERNSAWNPAIQLGKLDTQSQPAAKGRVLGGCQGGSNVMVIPWGNRLVPPFRDWALSKYVITIGAVAFPCAIFIAFFFWFLGFFTRRRVVRWAATALLGAGTAFLPYATVLYSHALVAGALFVAFGLLYLYSRGRIRGWAAPVAGLVLGLAFFTEYTVALVIIVVGLYGLWTLRRSRAGIVGFAVAAALPVIGLFAYNFAAFGSPLDTGYSHDFCWSAAQGAGFAGFTYPKLGPLWDLTLGTYRGLFFGAPFLLLAAPGAYVMWRRGMGLEAAVCLSCSLLIILAISAYWGWNGGSVDGPRYLVPIVPFLAFPAALFLDRALPNVWVTSVAVVLGAWSIVFTWILFLGGELFPISWLRNPLTEYSIPQLTGNHIPPNAGFFFGLTGWESLLPLLALIGLIVVFRAPRTLALVHNIPRLRPAEHAEVS